LQDYANQLDQVPELADFCSLCLCCFIPLGQLKENSSQQIDEQTLRQFLMAELAFLRSLFGNQPKLLAGFVPLIVQLLPDFFIQVSYF
jgi:hypothetical protein